MTDQFEVRTASGKKWVIDHAELMAQELPSAQLRKLSFANLDPTDFEELIFDLLVATGFVNVDWRKGTPKKASPSDGGRGIVADRGSPRCGRTYPLRALVCYKRNNRPPFRVRYWESPQIGPMLSKHPKLVEKHGVIEEGSIRPKAELIAAEREFFDKVWYVRSLIDQERVDAGERDAPDEKLHAQIDEARRRVRDEYGEENLGPWDDWGWGFIHGKLSANELSALVPIAPID